MCLQRVQDRLLTGPFCLGGEAVSSSRKKETTLGIRYNFHFSSARQIYSW